MGYNPKPHEQEGNRQQERKLQANEREKMG